MVVRHKGESSTLGGMRGGLSLKKLKNSMLAWTGPSLWTASPRVYWVMFSISTELATRRREPTFPQLSTPAFDAEIPDPASTGTSWNPEVFQPIDIPQSTQLVGHLQKGIFNSQTDFCLSPSHLLICSSKPMYTETWKQMPLEFHVCAFFQYDVYFKMYPSTIWDTCHISYRTTHQMCIQIWLSDSFWLDTIGQNRSKAFLALSERISEWWISSTSQLWPQGFICSENADLWVMARPLHSRPVA